MRVTLLLCFLLPLVACHKRFVVPAAPVESAAIVDQVKGFQSQVYQLKAELDVQATGLSGLFFHETMDVIAQNRNLLLSVRSFFGPPSLLIALSGEIITVYDFSGEPTFQKIANSKEQGVLLGDNVIHPHMLVDILLARVPLDEAQDVQVFRQDNLAKITGKIPNGFSFETIFDLKKNQPVKTLFVNPDSRVTYEVDYRSFTCVDGILFPREYVVNIKDNSHNATFRLRAPSVFLNGDRVADDQFILKPF
jgi:hypothetical protein